MNLNVYYNDNYNINLGVLSALHPFDGAKFAKVIEDIEALHTIEIVDPETSVSEILIDDFVDSLQCLLLKKKRYILKALEVSYIPLIPFSWIDRKILLPMRWGVSGTIEASLSAISGKACWNLSGGYHHASRASSEGFCIYNDIGIALDVLKRNSKVSEDDAILIIDIDAHHGNGNAHIYMENSSVFLFDIYNNDIYPYSPYTKERVDINIPLRSGAKGDEYLDRLENSLNRLCGDFKLAFVIAGTDVLSSDPLGGLSLSISECAERDLLVARTLSELSIPFVFLGGGGYCSESAKAISAGIKNVCLL